MYNIKKNDIGGWDAYQDPNGPFTTPEQANMAAWQASMTENVRDVNLSESTKGKEILNRIINNNSKPPTR